MFGLGRESEGKGGMITPLPLVLARPTVPRPGGTTVRCSTGPTPGPSPTPSGPTPHLHTLCAYHAWASSTLLAGVRALPHPSTTPFEDTGLFFGSIHGTLNHILLAEAVWFMRVTGAPSISVEGRSLTLQELSTYWGGPKAAWAKVTSSLEAVEVELQAMALRWKTVLETRKAEDRFSYRDTRGGYHESTVGDTLTHVFNHATHHRGQITAVLTQHGGPAPNLDLMHFLRESKAAT